MSIPQPQVGKEHYDVRRYNRKYVWLNYWYQIQAVLKLEPHKVLEIGPGNKTVTNILKKADVEVVTVDIDPALEPDVVASASGLPFENNSFDVILCSEVLEHLPYDEFKQALQELRRVTRRYVVLGLPNAGLVFQLVLRLPFLPQLTAFFKLPFFWKKHVFNGEHYWETGKSLYPLSRIRQDLNACGFKILNEQINYDDPKHWILVLEKTS